MEVLRKVELHRRMETNKRKAIPQILWHHGSCDLCSKRFVRVCQFNYDKQPVRDCRVCEKCLEPVTTK